MARPKTDNYVIGNDCGRCGDNRKYATTGSCLTCQRHYSAEYQRKHYVPTGRTPRPNPVRVEALENGERFFEGNECKKCNNTLRYASSSSCVYCARERGKFYKRRDRELERQRREAEEKGNLQG